MSRLLKGLSENTTTGFKFTAALILVALIPMALLGYISYRVIDARLVNDAQQKMDIGLKMAWTEYNIHGEQMRYGMMQAASTEDIAEAIKKANKSYLKKIMARWKDKRQYVDIWMIVNKDREVIARLNSEEAGDVLDINGLVKEAIQTRTQLTSTGIISSGVLEREGVAFQKQFIVPVISSALTDEYKRPGGNIEENALAFVVVTPVHENSRVTGAIITADIMNNDDYIPNAVADKMPGLITTVAMDGLRITTNLKDSKGRSANGTILANSAISIIKSGMPLRGEWNVLGERYISAFDPIMDNKGAIIGSLFVGIPKSSLWDIQTKNQTTIVAATMFGLMLALFISLIFKYSIIRPLKVLKEKADAFAKGDIDTWIDIEAGADAKDDIKILARTFNMMTGEVKKRTEDEKRYLKELEEKHRQLTDGHKLLTDAKEELEVAYEETQSQAEELNSANEELRLLNEDLDRKNVEVTDANRLIKKEEEELRKTKDKLSLIYDGIKGYLLLVEDDCTILEANRHFLEDYKLDEPLVIGKKLYHILGSNREEHLPNCPVMKSIKTKMPAETEIVVGNERILRCHSFPLIEEGIDPGRAVIYIEDITEQKMMMQRMVQSDKLSSLGELVSGVAHELNNPLTGIMGFSELMLNETFEERTKKRLREINEASHRCKRIVENLLTFARFHKPEKKQCNINNIITTAVELRAYQLKVSDIKVELNLAPSLPKTLADEHQLQQVLLNLINNAEHSIAEKGVKGKITISTEGKDKNIIIKVSDTGNGIPDDIISNIFNPFFTTKPVGKGTGLGLSISYGIIKEHGGNITANSRHGEGASFIIELPIIEKHDAEELAYHEDEAAQEQITGEGLRALVLDDEPPILTLLNEVLSDAGFRVDTAGRVEDALKLLKKTRYNIIISDIKMPGMDGKEFYRKVKAMNPKAARDIIFLSGDSASKETQNFFKETGNPFLHKPFTIEKFKKIISKRSS